MYRNKKFVTFFIVVCIVLCAAFPAMADVNDLSIHTDSNVIDTRPESLLVYTDSNAMMTLELNDSGYSVGTFSSLASINNTVSYSSLKLYTRLIDEESGMLDWRPIALNDDGTYRFYVPPGYVLTSMGVILYEGALPSPGVYRMQIDHSSDASFDVEQFYINTYKNETNVAQQVAYDNVTSFVEQFSGDFYSDFVIKMGSFDQMQFVCDLTEYLSSGSVISGLFKIAFNVSSDTPDFYAVGTSASTNIYEDGVSSSISGISSSVDEMTGEISEVADAIDALRGAMEPHYDNVLTQLHHITEQLHAFWDQLYNMFFLPQYTLLGEIRDAITGMETGLGGVISDASSAIQAKLQSVQDAVTSKIQDVTDQITNGFDNSELNASIENLSAQLGEVENSEMGAFMELSPLLEESPFEFPSFDELSNDTLSSLGFFSQVLLAFVFSMGEFAFLIMFSLALSLVTIFLGLYRFK